MRGSFYLLFSLIGCTHNDTVVNTSASEYFPNKIGDYWEYSVIDSTNTSDGVKQYVVKVRITGNQKLADNKDASVWQYQYPGNTDTVYVRIENDTVKTFTLNYSRTIQNLKYPRQIFPLPFQVDQKWNGKLFWIDAYAVSQASNGYLVNYHYIGPNMEYIDQLYFKPNIGFVNRDESHYDLGPIDHKIWRLQKYSLK